MLHRSSKSALLFLFLCGTSLGARAEVAASSPAAAKSLSPTAKEYFKVDGTGPEIGQIPFIQNVVKAGGSLRYMGERSGLHGYLLVKNAQVQIMYVTPDKKTVIMGGMFADDGQIVTPLQIAALAEKDKEVAAIMNGTAKQNVDVLRAGMQQGGMAELPGTGAADNVDNSEMPLIPASPGERLVMDLRASSGVILGNIDAPELIMVVSPNCAHCKRTWDEIKGAVKEGKLQVRLIPIGRDTKGEEYRIAGQLLRAKNPLEAWDSYVSGKKDVLAGDPDSTALRAVVANRAMTDRWNIMGTPYFVYRDNTKKIKIVQGKPERMAAVLADLIH